MAVAVRAYLCRAATLAALLLALAACHAMPSDDAQEGQLYGEVFADVARYHLDATDPDRLAMASLRALKEFDASLSVTEAEGIVYLRSAMGEDEFAAPPVDDAARWGLLAAQVVASARRASPEFASVLPDRADERLLDAALGGLDRFSRYVRPSVAAERRAERDGFVGLGLTLEIAPPVVRVAAVLPGTPAAAAGVRPEDRIVAVDGKSLASLSADAIHRRLDGPQDTLVSLEIARAGLPADLQLTMRRTLIVEESVSLTETQGIAVLKVRSFNQRTAASAARLLADAHRDMGADLHGIVLDLRGNPGGLLEQSVDLASLFLAHGLVVETAGRVPESLQAFPATGWDPVERLPLAVLVNGSSASAAEIVAAALQDAGRAVVIGTSTFGKGTVQTVFRTGNGGELTVTWARLLAPGGYPLHHHGVVPTLCTAGLADAPEAPLARAGVPTSLQVPRERLDDAAWEKLRAQCPPQREATRFDFRIAQHVLDAPALYQAALLHAPAGLPVATEARLR